MLTLSLLSSSSDQNKDEQIEDDQSGKTSYENDASTSLISKGAHVEGTFDSKNVNLRVEGSIHGDISTDRRVVVAEGAEVRGTINAQTIRLAGYVEGHVLASEELVLRPSAEVHATLEAEVLEIQPGADFTGEVPEVKSFVPDSANPSLDRSELVSAARASEDNSVQKVQEDPKSADAASADPPPADAAGGPVGS